MALSDTSKTTLASLFSLLGTDMSLSGAIRSAADRLLAPGQAAAVIALCAKNPSGANVPSAAANLAAIVADVAAG